MRVKTSSTGIRLAYLNDGELGVAMREKSVNVKDLAAVLGFTKSFVQSLKRGRVGIDRGMALRISKALGVSLTDLFEDAFD